MNDKIKNKLEQLFYNILGIIGFAVGLTILLAIIRIGELFADFIVQITT